MSMTHLDVLMLHAYHALHSVAGTWDTLVNTLGKELCSQEVNIPRE
jgi:hypothetical protein